MPKIIINADDYGWHPAINTAIKEAIAFGTVNSFSISPQSDFLDWEEIASTSLSGIDVGVHLTLVGKFWMSKNKHYINWKDLFSDLAFGGKKSRIELQEEVDMQIKFFFEKGVLVNHLDSHQHVHSYPPIWKVVNESAKRWEIPRVRWPQAPNWRYIRLSPGGIALQLFCSLLKKEPGIQYRPCIGIQKSGHNDLNQIKKEYPESEVEVIVHPAVFSENLHQKLAHWNYEWEKEYEMLLSKDFKLWLEKIWKD